MLSAQAYYTLCVVFKGNWYNRALFGFVGRNTEAAFFLLHDADRHANGSRFRALGTAILDSFAALPMSPPLGEGFDLFDGSQWVFVGDLVWLRALCEGCTAMLRGWQHEQQRGVDHPHWLQWCVEFADWLLPQEGPYGGFPRHWRFGSGAVSVESFKSSYNVVSFLLRLSAITQEQRYFDAAVRAAEFCWNESQQFGTFIGGTLETVLISVTSVPTDISSIDSWPHRSTLRSSRTVAHIPC